MLFGLHQLEDLTTCSAAVDQLFAFDAEVEPGDNPYPNLQSRHPPGVSPDTTSVDPEGIELASRDDHLLAPKDLEIDVRLRVTVVILPAKSRRPFSPSCSSAGKTCAGSQIRPARS